MYHETRIRSCKGYPYPAVLFSVYAESGFPILRCTRDEAKMEHTERNARYTYVCRAFQKSKCHFDSVPARRRAASISKFSRLFREFL